jgi:hypothetical protein
MNEVQTVSLILLSERWSYIDTCLAGCYNDIPLQYFEIEYRIL